MTRHEFNATFKSHLDNTEGYTVQQLNQINDEVFAAVADLDVEDTGTKSLVDRAKEEAFFRMDAAA